MDGPKPIRYKGVKGCRRGPGTLASYITTAQPHAQMPLRRRPKAKPFAINLHEVQKRPKKLEGAEGEKGDQMETV